MTTQTNHAIEERDAAAVLERVIIEGDLASLTAAERVTYYLDTCRSLRLNPRTKPFLYLELDKKLQLYASRACTDQLRKTQEIAVVIVSRERLEDMYIVTAKATTSDGRTDESIGVVPLSKEGGEWKTTQQGKHYFVPDGTQIALKGAELANALMKAETKAKRRVTLSIVGLGWLSEDELDTLPQARRVNVDIETGEILEPQAGPAPTTPARLPVPPKEALAGLTRRQQIDKLVDKCQVLGIETGPIPQDLDDFRAWKARLLHEVRIAEDLSALGAEPVEEEARP